MFSYRVSNGASSASSPASLENENTRRKLATLWELSSGQATDGHFDFPSQRSQESGVGMASVYVELLSCPLFHRKLEMN